MQNLVTKTFAAAILGLCVASTASALPAEETFTAKFEYMPGARAEQTYADFRRVARKACRRHEGDIRLGASALRATRTCEAELIESAVRKTGLTDLMAYHDMLTDKKD